MAMAGKWCAFCQLDLSQYSDKEILETFNLCRSHSKELKQKEKPMAVCSKCQSQDMQYKSGISQKTGKQWQAYQCGQCKTMHGMNGVPWGDKKAPAQTYQPEVQQSFKPPVNPLEKKLDLIISMLKTLQGDMGVKDIDIVNEELQVEANQSKLPF